MILALILAEALLYKGVLQSSDAAVTLESGIYEVKNDVSITGTDGNSAIKVKDGAKVAIYVPKGASLTATGSSGTDAIGRNVVGSGAGAGIEVPLNAKLILTGEGIVTATAGASAGNAASGGNATDASYVDGDSDKTAKMTSGGGGTGGAGGGGGAAGIGGHGGVGGEGGSGGSAYTISFKSGESTGGNGQNGVGGSVGGSAGTMVFLGKLTVTATATANAGSAGGAGARSNWKMVIPTTSQSYNYFMGFGGGGGGGGGAGHSWAYGIGGGAGGGGGGGGGGSGGVFWDADADDLLNDPGDGLGGAAGNLNGTAGASWKNEWRSDYGESGVSWSADEEDCQGGSGGSGGQAGGSSGVGSVFKSSLTTLTDTTVGATIQDAETDADAQCTIFFSDPGGKLTTVPADMTATVGMPLGEFTGAGTKSVTEAVIGWYAADDAAFKTMIFDGNGQPAVSCYCFCTNVTLVPRIGSAGEESTGVWIDGDQVGGPNGAVSGDGWMYAPPVLTISDSTRHTVYGINRQGKVCLKLTGNAQITLEDLSLLVDAKYSVSGAISVESGCKAEIEIAGSVTIGATAAGMAGIHCPAGASVRLWCAGGVGGRGVAIAEPTYDQAMAVRVLSDGVHRNMLVVSAGTGAAAIGGAEGEVCGDITIDNCDLWTSPNGGVAGKGVCDIGNGVLGEGTDPRLGGFISFVLYPVLCATRQTDTGVRAETACVYPRPHGTGGMPFAAVAFGDRTFFVPPCNVGFLENEEERSFNTVGLGGVMFTGNLPDLASLVKRLADGVAGSAETIRLAIPRPEAQILRHFASFSDKKGLTFLDVDAQVRAQPTYGSFNPDGTDAKDWSVTLQKDEITYLSSFFSALYRQLKSAGI